MVLAIVPAAPPTRKNQRATSCPAPISANVPYLLGSRLICSAFWCVPKISRAMRFRMDSKFPVFKNQHQGAKVSKANDQCPSTNDEARTMENDQCRSANDEIIGLIHFDRV